MTIHVVGKCASHLHLSKMYIHFISSLERECRHTQFALVVTRIIFCWNLICNVIPPSQISTFSFLPSQKYLCSCGKSHFSCVIYKCTFSNIFGPHWYALFIESIYNAESYLVIGTTIGWERGRNGQRNKVMHPLFCKSERPEIIIMQTTLQLHRMVQ